MTTEIILDSMDEARAVAGARDQNLRLLRDRLNVRVIARNGRVRLEGEPESVEQARAAITTLLERVRRGQWTSADVLSSILISQGENGAENSSAAPLDDRLSAEGVPGEGEPGVIDPSASPQPLRIPGGFSPRTQGQGRYLDLIKANDIVICTGPAGTGKTFLAVLLAVGALKQGVVQRIVLCRPAVEAGEKLGFLPGDFQAKINPYLRPLYDAMNAILEYDTVKRYMDRELIEIVPLAFMRGRTLNDAFIILDEGQNTTIEQMKMFLTRMGERSRIVVTGDTSQIDLPDGKASGLVHARKILKNVEGIGFQEMTGKDIVRHPLVWKIVQAYDKKKK